MLRSSGVRRMRIGFLLACLTASVAACSSDGDAAERGDGSGSTSSPSASSDSSDVDALWAEALASQSEPIGFQAYLGIGGPASGGGAEDVLYLSRTDGSWESDPDTWGVTTTVIDPETGDELAFEARSIGADTWMQSSAWPEPLGGCWLEMPPGALPVGQLALTAGTPRFLSVLDAFEPQQPGAAAGAIEGTIPLDEALGLFSVRVAQALGYRDPSSADGEVPFQVDLAGPGVDGYRLDGAALLAAAERDGATANATEARFLERILLAAELYDYDTAPEAEPPAPGTVMTGEEMSAGVGCGS